MSTSEVLASLPLYFLIFGRIFAAGTHLFAPKWAMRLIGVNAAGTAAIGYGRMFGIRNAVLAVGLLNLDSFSSPATFVALNVLIDAVDAVSFYTEGRQKDISAKSATQGTAISLLAVTFGVLALLITPSV
ncbi:hypothetical protein [Streptomyces sp. CA-179760]|uniref:hypothetical protein n=1 Tax=Streptomyces sp. CA-179760 TaxID=3240054 RepID=UPI003D901BFF